MKLLFFNESPVSVVFFCWIFGLWIQFKFIIIKYNLWFSHKVEEKHLILRENKIFNLLDLVQLIENDKYIKVFLQNFHRLLKHISLLWKKISSTGENIQKISQIGLDLYRLLIVELLYVFFKKFLTMVHSHYVFQLLELYWRVLNHSDLLRSQLNKNSFENGFKLKQ